jgi:hypothetical protein
VPVFLEFWIMPYPLKLKELCVSSWSTIGLKLVDYKYVGIMTKNNMKYSYER